MSGPKEGEFHLGLRSFLIPETSMLIIHRIGTWLLLAAAVIAFVFSTDPSKASYGTDQIVFMKYMPFLLSALAFSCLVIGIRVREVLNWRVLLIILFITTELCGGMYAHFIMGRPLEDTLLGRALGGFVFLSILALAADRRELYYFLPRLMWIMLIFGLIMIVELILFRLGVAFSNLTQMFHVDIVLLAGCAMLAKYIIKNKLLRIVVIVLGIVAGLISGKATGMLVSIVLLASMVIYKDKQLSSVASRTSRERSMQLTYFRFTIILLSLAALATVFLATLNFRLETHEDKVRDFTYVLRLGEFLGSPLIGKLYTNDPIVEVGGTLSIPSHSDILDLLAFGGILSIIMFFIPIGYIALRWIRDKRDNYSDLRGYFSIFVLCYILVMMVNPVFAVPRVVFFFWVALGLSLLPFPLAGEAASKKLVWGRRY